MIPLFPYTQPQIEGIHIEMIRKASFAFRYDPKGMI